jgi:hypothetical protein
MRKIVIVKFCWLMCIAILIAMSGCGEESEEGGKRTMLTPGDLLPDDNDISGWVSVGAYEEANDYDGGVCSTALVHMRIYDQGSEDNAMATYDRVATGIGIPWNGAGVEARIDESGLASYMVEFWQQSFFVQIIIEEKTDEALNVAKLFASHVSGEIG